MLNTHSQSLFFLPPGARENSRDGKKRDPRKEVVLMPRHLQNQPSFTQIILGWRVVARRKRSTVSVVFLI